MNKTRIPSIEEMDAVAECNYCEHDGITLPPLETLTEQRDNLHAIATELEAKLTRIKAIADNPPLASDAFASAISDVITENES